MTKHKKWIFVNKISNYLAAQNLNKIGSVKSSTDFVKNVLVVFSCCWYKTFYPGIVLSTFKATERVWYFLFYSGWPDISFSKVIGKRNLFIISKGKNRILIFNQPFRRVSSLGSFMTSSFSRYFYWLWFWLFS